MGTSLSRITVSIVSHRHGSMVSELLADLARFQATGLTIVLTLNVPEDTPVIPANLPVTLISNRVPKGFGANHNAAFRASGGEYFCVLNPDVRMAHNPFPRLVDLLATEFAGVAAPLAIDSDGRVQDSARRFPTPLRLVVKLLYKLARRPLPLDYSLGQDLLQPDFTSGLFMLLRRTTFESLQGFDERYYLYYEDVDICARLRLAGLRVLVDPAVRVVHDARRDSHRYPKHALWHLRSIARFFLSSAYRKLFLSGAL